MSAASAALAGRLAAERIMTDTILIQRVTGSTPNETTGKSTPTYAQVYSGKARIQSYQPFEQTPVAGGQQLTIQRTSIHIPVTVTGVAVEDVASVTASATNPGLVGNQYRVAGLHEKTAQTAQRLLVDQKTST